MFEWDDCNRGIAGILLDRSKDRNGSVAVSHLRSLNVSSQPFLEFRETLSADFTSTEENPTLLIP